MKFKNLLEENDIKEQIEKLKKREKDIQEQIEKLKKEWASISGRIGFLENQEYINKNRG